MLLANLAGPLHAADPTPESMTDGAPAFLELSVNGVDKGAVRVLVRGTNVFVLVSSLREAGLINIPGQPENIGGELYIRVSALGPRVQYMFDEDNLTLALTAEPSLLAPVTIDLASAPEKIDFISNPAGFINYAFTADNFERATLLSEQGFSFGTMFLGNTLSATSAGRVQRINTSATIDNRRRMTRTIIGDTIADAGVLGGASQIAGISYAKNFAINPYFTPFPGQRFAGLVSTPSTADVYVNGLLVRTVDLPPGPFNLQNLPALSGAGATRIVIRNAFGLTQELGAPYYLGTRVLRRGLHDFSYSAGFERRPVQSSIGSYGNPALTGRHRYGLTDTLTIGAFAAGDRRKIAGGPELTVTLPFGTFAVSSAGSHQQGDTGAAASAQYVYQSARFSFGGAATYMSPRYATVGLDKSTDRATWQTSAFASTRLGEIDFALNYYHQDFRDLGTSAQVNLTSSMRLAGRFNLSVSLFHNRTAQLRPNNGVFAALTMAIGGDTSATVSANADSAGTVGALQVQKSRPLGTGFSYLAQASVGPRAVSVLNAQYQGDYGLYEADVTHVEGNTSATLTAAGAVTFVGGAAFFTRPVQDAYGLIQVPGVPDVTGYISHQDTGKTDARGNLLVPNLLSYYGNQLGIEPLDIPLDYSVAEIERTIAPSYRGGAVVRFPVKRLQAFQGVIQLDQGGKTVAPAYGDFTVDLEGHPVKSPLNAEGAFYLEDLTPGSHTAVVEFNGEACRFTIEVPPSAERFVNMGTLTCAP